MYICYVLLDYPIKLVIYAEAEGSGEVLIFCTWSPLGSKNASFGDKMGPNGDNLLAPSVFICLHISLCIGG